jgi:hypothetical protein
MNYDLREFMSKLPKLADELIKLTSEARSYIAERRERERQQHDALPGFMYRPDRVGEFGP